MILYMNIAIPIKNFKNNNYLFLDPIENTIIKNSIFHRIILSNDLISMNNINIYLSLENITIEQYYNKYKCFINDNLEIFNNIIEIENQILESVNIENKSIKFNIKDQLNSGSIRIFSEDNLDNKEYKSFNVILKISGIWETETEYGVTFKFYTI